jgi:hypothetical protein
MIWAIAAAVNGVAMALVMFDGGRVDHHTTADLACAPVTTAGQRPQRLADQAHARDHQSSDERGPTRDENDKFAHRHPPDSTAGECLFDVRPKSDAASGFWKKVFVVAAAQQAARPTSARRS